MRKPHPYTSLVIMLFVLCCGFFLVHLTRDEGTKLKIAPLMVEAAQLSQHWMDIISAEKATRDIYPDVISNVQNQAMIGNDFTMITTTLGSLQSKEISTNPDFAALMVRWMAEAGLERGAKAGVIASGSFPSLIVSTLSALQTLDADVVLLTSVGASSYGANQPAATWPDMEYWLQQNGNLQYASAMVSRGAENDNGGGLTEAGILLIDSAVNRNQMLLYLPPDLKAAIEKKYSILQSEDIDILINIGGNQAALGRCQHSSALPNGFQTNIQVCEHEERGLLQEINALGIPVINLLNIKDIAMEYGMDISPGRRYAPSRDLYSIHVTSPKAMFTIILTLAVSMILLIRYSKKRTPKYP